MTNSVTDPDLPAYDLMGLKVSVFDRKQLVNHIIDVVNSRNTRVCFGYSLGYIALFKKMPGLYEKCNAFDLMVTDGRYFYLFAKCFGAPLKCDISIPFVSQLMMELANEKGYSIMIIGSTDDTNLKATTHVRTRYPGATVYDGLTGGRFSESEQLQLVQAINDKKPDFLFIGTSTPIKEDFAAKWKDKLDVSFIVPFGGMIDGLAGKVRLTPPLLKKLGLATFIRIAQEPRRLLGINLWMAQEIFFRIIPLSIFNRGLLRRKNFNLIRSYLAK